LGIIGDYGVGVNTHKKGTPKSSLILYHPMVGAVRRATGVASTLARSKGKL